MKDSNCRLDCYPCAEVLCVLECCVVFVSCEVVTGVGHAVWGLLRGEALSVWHQVCALYFWVCVSDSDFFKCIKKIPTD
jgi:hypothetical protein